MFWWICLERWRGRGGPRWVTVVSSSDRDLCEGFSFGWRGRAVSNGRDTGRRFPAKRKISSSILVGSNSSAESMIFFLWLNSILVFSLVFIVPPSPRQNNNNNNSDQDDIAANPTNTDNTFPFHSVVHYIFVQVSWWRARKPIECYVAYSHYIFKCWFRWHCTKHLLWTWHCRYNWNYGKLLWFCWCSVQKEGLCERAGWQCERFGPRRKEPNKKTK